jgi:integrase
MAYLDENQVQTLLLTAEEIGSRYYPLYFLAINTGMRQGEMLGLRWSDLDWDRKRLKVHRQLVYLKHGKYEFSEPKTKSGKRTILLGDAVLQVLRIHQGRQESLRFRKGSLWKDQNLIFPSVVGTPVIASNLRRSFRKLLEASDCPEFDFMTCDILRHL